MRIRSQAGFLRTVKTPWLTLTVSLTYQTLIGSHKLKPRWEFLRAVHVSMWLAGSFALLNLGTNGAKPVQPPGLVRRKEKQSMPCPGSSHKSGKCPSKFIATVGKLCLEPAQSTQRALLQSDSCIIKSIKGHIHNTLTDLIERNRIKLTLKTLLRSWISNFKCLSGTKWSFHIRHLIPASNRVCQLIAQLRGYQVVKM